MKQKPPKRVRAIIIKDGKLLAIKRTKPGETYWVLPGGGIEPGETAERALIREVKEETGLDCSVGDYVTSQTYMSSTGEQDVAFYQATITGGTLGAGTGPEFTQPVAGAGTYEAQWIPLPALGALDLRPNEMRELILTLHPKTAPEQTRTQVA